MKNWKTTLFGLLAGTLLTFSQAAQARKIDPTAPPVTMGNILPGVAIAAIGAFAKDHDKTGV